MNDRVIARIVGLGAYLPKRVLTNADLEKMVDTSDEWIVSRTGIKERRIAEKDEFTSDMGTYAAQEALKQAGILPDAIDAIIVASMSPDYLSPSTACLIQTKIGAERSFAFDIQAACSGFLYALSVAQAFIESRACRTVLVVAAEKMSAFIDYSDRKTCVLFGDGASACVVSSEGKGLKIESMSLGCDGSLADLIKIPGGGCRHPASEESVREGKHYFQMEGNEVFKFAVRKMIAASEECLRKANLDKGEIDWFVPHQANKRIIEVIAKNFHIDESKIVETLHKYGNTSAASIAMALCDLLEKHKIQAGERLLLTAFGGGATWGAAILVQEAE